MELILAVILLFAFGISLAAAVVSTRLVSALADLNAQLDRQDELLRPLAQLRAGETLEEYIDRRLWERYEQLWGPPPGGFTGVRDVPGIGVQRQDGDA